MELTDIQKDILMEVGNIGIGHAATALSKMLDGTVNIELPKLQVTNIDGIINAYPTEGYLTNCGIVGEIGGDLAFVLSKKELLRVVELMTKAPKNSVKEIDEMGKSAIAEVMNILSGAYLTSLSDFSGFNLMPNIPDFKDMPLKDALSSIVKDGKEILEIKTSFNILEESLYAHMYLILETSDMIKILDKVK